MAHTRYDAPPFDQGLFLLHLNKGREALRLGNTALARTELELAQAIRPDDEDVLNLLSVVYFKAGEMESAEKITRRLVAENAESAVLHSNLGVILVKRGALDDAEVELRRAIELRPDHSKSHLYLGFIYRQYGKLGLALEHFRFAGAEKLVVELGEQLRRSTRDSGELRAMAAGDSPPKSTTAKLVIPKEFRAPAPARLAAGETARPEDPGARLFRVREHGAVEINFRGEVLVRRGTVASYGGRIGFASDPKLEGTKAEPLLRASGQGTIFLADRGRKPMLIELKNEFFSAEGSRILAIGPTLSFRYEPVHDFPRRRRVDVLRIFGRGSLVLAGARHVFDSRVGRVSPERVLARPHRLDGEPRAFGAPR